MTKHNTCQSKRSNCYTHTDSCVKYVSCVSDIMPVWLHTLVVSAVSRMQQQYHACNSTITHATAQSRMQQHHHACNSTITHATAQSRMQQHYHACNSTIQHNHACNSIVTHATLVSRMQQQQACNVTHAVYARGRTR